MPRSPHFQMYIDANFEYRWRLVASDGRVLSKSCAAYKNSDECRQSIELVKIEAPPAAVLTP
jgi:uncharacterized protein YegP (UPF0339 family)